MGTWTVRTRGEDRVVRGELTRWTQLVLIPRYADVGSWSVQLGLADPAALDLLDLLDSDDAADVGLVFERDDGLTISGPVVDYQDVWGPGDPGAGTLALSGSTDTRYLAERLAYQDPTQPASLQSATAYDVRTGLAETVMRDYVAVNAGYAALADRRVPGLGFEADQGRGGTLTERARMDDLLELCQRIALAGGDLGFQIVQVGNGLQFQVTQPRDLRADVVFSPELGTLAGWARGATRAESTSAVVAGSGQGTERAFVEMGSLGAAARWGRVETFVDRRDTGDTTELQQAGTQELTEHAEQVSIAIQTRDTPQITFGRDYQLGDRVSVEVRGRRAEHVIRELEIRVDDHQQTPGTATKGRVERVKALIGTPRATFAPGFRHPARKTARRVGALERRQ
jgi:hypothetical protein